MNILADCSYASTKSAQFLQQSTVTGFLHSCERSCEVARAARDSRRSDRLSSPDRHVSSRSIINFIYFSWRLSIFAFSPIIGLSTLVYLRFLFVFVSLASCSIACRSEFIWSNSCSRVFDWFCKSPLALNILQQIIKLIYIYIYISDYHSVSHRYISKL